MLARSAVASSHTSSTNFEGNLTASLESNLEGSLQAPADHSAIAPTELNLKLSAILVGAQGDPYPALLEGVRVSVKEALPSPRFSHRQQLTANLTVPSSQPAPTKQSIKPLTLESLRQQVEQDQSSPPALSQSPETEDLPSLEAEPAQPVDPSSLDSSPLPADTEAIPAEPPATADLDSEIADPEPTPPPVINDEVELNELPDSLFADPNPLSLPTQTEEVDIDQNPVVTLEQAIELAYRNNQTLQAALLTLEQAEAALREAEAARLPTVSIGSDLTNAQESSSSTTVLSGNVEVGYNLLTGGSRSASIRAAELQQQVSALAVETQQEQIRLVTSNLYYALQEAGEQIRINQSFLQEAERNLRDSQLRQEVGVGTRFDVLRAEVQFANARQSLIQAQGDQRIARRDIARLLNLPPTSGLVATPVAVAENWPLTLEESILLAFQRRAELEQQLLQADINEQQRQIALAAIRPQVSLFARYGIQSILEGNNSPFVDDTQDSYSFGARFSMRLYDGGAARAQARQQEIAGAVNEEEFSENRSQIRFDVEQAFFNLESNQENIATSRVAVAQAEEALELANLRLQAGVGTQLDVLTAQSELTQAQANNVSAILGYNRALAAMERAVSNIGYEF